MKLYKLTNEDMTTYMGFRWEAGVRMSKPFKPSPELCSEDVFHAYKDPNLALLFNTSHAGIEKPLLWEAEGEVCCEDFSKVGCFELTLLRELKLPEWYVNPRSLKRVMLRFGMLCLDKVLPLYKDKDSLFTIVHELLNLIYMEAEHPPSDTRRMYLLNDLVEYNHVLTHKPEGRLGLVGRAVIELGKAALLDSPNGFKSLVCNAVIYIEDASEGYVKIDYAELASEAIQEVEEYE